MAEYRAYIVGDDGHFMGFEGLVCSNDAHPPTRMIEAIVRMPLPGSALRTSTPESSLQPSAFRKSAWAAVSTPSAMTSSPRLRPMTMMERTMAVSSGGGLRTDLLDETSIDLYSRQRIASEVT